MKRVLWVMGCILPLIQGVYAKGMFVSDVMTTPGFASESTFDGSDLLINFSSANEDIRLLTLHEKWDKARKKALKRPNLVMSGALEVQVLGQEMHEASSQSDFDLTRAELDMFSEVNPSFIGMISLVYDNGFIPGQGYRISNSRLYIKRAFLSYGDFYKSPWYVTAGQTYIPFGRYSSAMLSAPETLVLGRTSARAVLVGMNRKQDHTQSILTGYVFKGDMAKANDTNRINNYGLNAQWQYAPNKNKTWTVGASYIANMADSSGMVGLLGNVGNDGTTLLRTTGGVDLHSELYFKPFQINAEWVRSVKSFETERNSVNYSGRPEAYHVELDYHLDDRFHTVWALSWGGARDTSTQVWGDDASALPKNSVALTYNAVFWKDTAAAIEYRHMTWDASSGYVANQVVAQFGIYF